MCPISKYVKNHSTVGFYICVAALVNGNVKSDFNISFKSSCITSYWNGIDDIVV